MTLPTGARLSEIGPSGLPRNRMLGIPKMHYIPKLSLPRLMAHYAKPPEREHDFRSAHGIIPGASRSHKPRKREPEFAPQISLKQLAPLHEDEMKKEADAIAASTEESFRPATGDCVLVDASGWPVAGGGLGALKKAQKVDCNSSCCRPQSSQVLANFSQAIEDDEDDSEFMRRRRAHPRLRWPRLASRQLPISCEDGLGAIDEFPEAGDSITLMPMTPSTPSRPRNFPRRPAILPRVKSQAPVRPGTASTLHCPIGEGDMDNDLEVSGLLRNDSARSAWLTASNSSLGTTMLSSQPSLSSLGSALRCDRKWFMRMAPISCLPSEPSLQAARRAIATRAGSSDTCKYLNVRGWGVNDDYLDSLISSHLASSGHWWVQVMDLSENLITEDGIHLLTHHGIPDNLKSLNLASNQLGEKGGFGVSSLVVRCRQLVELDLAGNAIGDAVVEELCIHLERHCKELNGLCLARCELGATARAGTALGNLVTHARHLKSLDLNWNAIHGPGAYGFFQGLYENGTNSMNLTQLNLAWNRIGSGMKGGETRKQEALKAAKLLASVFADGEVLFHMDISYNGFDAEECEILSLGLQFNHTLFGLHILGNDATIDDLGFVVPADKKELKSQFRAEDGLALAHAAHLSHGLSTLDDDVDMDVSLSTNQTLQARVNKYVHSVPSKLRRQHPADLDPPDNNQPALAQTKGSTLEGFRLRHNPSLHSLSGNGLMSFSDADIQAESRWVKNRSRVQPVAHAISSHVDAIHNAKCCWICENWVQYEIIYTPGLSGSERLADEVQSVYALFAIDGFTRPTNLSRREEAALNTRQLQLPTEGDHTKLGEDRRPAAQQKKRAAQRSGRAPKALTVNGKIIKWVGVRMLPPSSEAMEIIFIVNGEASVANDMDQKTLRCPKTISIKSSEGVTSPDEETKIVSVSAVNTLKVGECHSVGKQDHNTALVVLDDPSNRNEFIVMPRKLIEVSVKAKARDAWTYATSSFKDYLRDCDHENTIRKCFDHDWQNSRLGQIIKEEATRKAIQDYVRPLYRDFICCFMEHAYTGLETRIHAAGLSFLNFKEWIVENGGQGPGKCIDERACKINDPDCIFIAANVIDKAKKKEFKVLPEKGLARFQFLEAVVRLAFRRFSIVNPNKCTPEAAGDAVKSLVEMLQIEKAVVIRDELQMNLFTEECCIIYREHMDALKEIYEAYKSVSCYPGRTGKFMAYGAWMEFVFDCEILSEDFSQRLIGTSFALGKEIHVDITTEWRNMELSFGEFLVAIGALVVLQKDYDSAYFGEHLEELFGHHIEIARDKRRKGGRVRSHSLFSLPETLPLITFLQQIFEDADDDESGTVDQREFRRVFNEEKNREEMSRLGVSLNEVNLMFRTLDKEGTGELTLEQITEGFLKIQLAFKGIEKAISYVRKVFTDADTDGSGTLSFEEFRKLFDKPSVVKKLTILGISPDDFEELFRTVNDEELAEVSVDQIIEALVRMRDPANVGLRGLRILQKTFTKADLDGSGELSQEEVLNAYGSEEVVEKLQQVNLAVPDWTTLFEELDLDHSGGLTWEEIEEGMKPFWAKNTLSSMPGAKSH